jgi:hypothetical protein
MGRAVTFWVANREGRFDFTGAVAEKLPAWKRLSRPEYQNNV